MYSDVFTLILFVINVWKNRIILKDFDCTGKNFVILITYICFSFV